MRNSKVIPKLKWGWCIGLVMGLMLVLAACTPAETTPVAADCPDPVQCPTCETCANCEACEDCEICPEVEVPESPLSALSEHEDIYAMWSESTHSDTWDEGKGPNTYCSRCHSPQNWDPAAYLNAAAVPDENGVVNCNTCKFPFDAELRIADTMDFVAEEDWANITCSQCHFVEDDMIDTTTLAWFDNASGSYIYVDNSTDLCEMCHVQSTGMIPGAEGAASGGTDHSVDLRGSAHTNWAQTAGDGRPETCSDCHNPHSQQPTTCEECHSGVTSLSTHIKGLNAIHLDRVTCMACHDASGADVGPDPNVEGSKFTTIETTMGRRGLTTTAIISHSVQWNVACDRCHFEENVWELPVLTADGEVPSDDAGGGGPP